MTTGKRLKYSSIFSQCYRLRENPYFEIDVDKLFPYLIGSDIFIINDRPIWFDLVFFLRDLENIRSEFNDTRDF